MADTGIIRIKPHFYVHVLDNNSNVTRTETGPLTFVKQDHEKVVLDPQPMITIPPQHYAVIQNPCARTTDGRPFKDAHGQMKLLLGETEVRFEQDPFPLYPGEKLAGPVQPLQVIAPMSALRLRALRDFVDVVKGVEVPRIAGDEWLFRGPGTYIPHVAVKVVETITATIIGTNSALQLSARKPCKDHKGVERKAGEVWLVRDEGAYLPDVDEEIVCLMDAFILTDKKAVHLQALKTFKDIFGNERKAGEEWLVTNSDVEVYIPDVYEKVVGEVNITTLSGRQYCVVLDPCDSSGKPQLGRKELRKGEAVFFLQPGERLESGIQNVYVLGEEEALLLRAKEGYNDTDLSTKQTIVRRPGDRWMIHGPCDFVPAVEVEIVELRRSIPLDENEGIYVRDLKTGKVRSVTGTTYMLKSNEELWEKELPAEVEELLAAESDALANDRAGSESFDVHEEDRVPSKARGPISRSRAQEAVPAVSAAIRRKPRDKTRVVSYRVPHNCAVQIYDYKSKRARVAFGPDLIMLGPDEVFTVLALSGGKPKRPNHIRTLALALGPDFMTDIIVVETADHTRLRLQLAYNWEFRVARGSKDDAARLFSIPDYRGDACKAVASRVRGAVATVSFDHFHRHSADLIRHSVCGIGDDGEPRDELFFPSNNLVITNVDIQSVEPVDNRTKDALQKSVQLAIEITTNSQEATARHEAQRLEQEARGKLERQRISDEAESEKARSNLLELRANSSAVESTGCAKAEAKARAEAANIEGRAAVEQAKLKAEAAQIENEAQLYQLKSKSDVDITFQREFTSLEIDRARRLAEIETSRTKDTIRAIGADTIRAIATSGPEMQVKLLQSLGLQGFLVTDGKNPINLFQTAAGFIGAQPPAALLPHSA